MKEIESGVNSLQLQPRDLELLSGLFECRAMTADHVSALYFEGKREYTKKRLQKLKAEGLIGARRRRVNEPAILFLTRKAFLLLKSEGRLDRHPAISANSFEVRAKVSELTIRHELEVMDVKAAFHTAIASSDTHSITEFSTWPLLHEFRISRPGTAVDTPVRPDGFIRIHEKEDGAKGFFHDCFLEVDRSSKDQVRLIQQASCYLEYYRTGDFALRQGGTREELKEFPFRVLMVLKSAERRNNTAERLLQNNPPIFSLVWLTTFAEVRSNPLGAIWMRPCDYREAVTGTAFDAEKKMRGSIYQHQTAREHFIENRVRKLKLLPD